MGDDPFDRNFDPPVGRAEQLAPGLRRLVAPNASPMTFRGTNTYLLGEAEIAVIDPGPADPVHLAALRAAVGDMRRISHILVTHSHLDHSPMAAPLARECDAPVLALGDSAAGRSSRMTRLAAKFSLGGGEGVDAAFAPTRNLRDGEVVATGEWALTALATPGHFGNHLCFAWGETGGVFSGDHVMSWATTLVSPPDGDLGAFMRSLKKMGARRQDRHYFPGHGAVLQDPHGMIAHQTQHRQMRESQILAALASGAATPRALAARIYTEVAPALIPAAARNVFAHLLDLTERNLVAAQPQLAFDAEFSLIS